jgi:hypothetical protein
MATTDKVVVPLSVRVWAKRNPNGTVTIRIASNAPKFISTIEDVPGKRVHKHLFAKFKAILKLNSKWPS